MRTILSRRLGKSVDIIPPKKGDDGKPDAFSITLIGVEENPFYKPGQEDYLHYNLAVLLSYEAPRQSGNTYALEDFLYGFCAGNNRAYLRHFECGFLTELNGSWYSLFLREFSKVKRQERTRENMQDREYIAHLKKEMKMSDEEITEAFKEEMEAEEPPYSPHIFCQRYEGDIPIIKRGDSPLGVVSALSSIMSAGFATCLEENGASKLEAEDIESSESWRRYIHNLFAKDQLLFPKFRSVEKAHLPESLQGYEPLSLTLPNSD